MSRSSPSPTPPRVLDPLAVRVESEEVWRFLSYPEGKTPPERSRERIESEMKVALGWIQARGIYRIEAADAARDLLLPPPSPRAGDPVRGETPRAFALALVTAGAVLEEQIRHRLAASDSAGALILDAFGSAAAERAADVLTVQILSDLGRADAPPNAPSYPGCRVSPGYGEWPLEAQDRLFARLPHDEIGVSLLSSRLMVPRKSISFALWLDAEGRPLTDLGGCARCPQPRCSLRRT